MDKWLFWSDRGEGKTSFMTQMANDLCDVGYKVTYVSGTEEKLPLRREIIHLWCSDSDRDINYTLAVLKEKAQLGRIDFLFIDDFSTTGFRTVSMYEIPCHVIACDSSMGSSPISNRVPIGLLLGIKENFIEIQNDGKLSPKDYLFNQTFNSNKNIKYVDIISRYLRDKKIEQLINE
jgi:hypothetical protein